MRSNTIYKLAFWTAVFSLICPIILLPPQFQPSSWSGTILFRIGITVFLSAFLYGYFIKKSFPVFLPQKNSAFYKTLVVLLIFFSFLFISVLFSQDILFSIFSGPSRAGGFLNLLFLFIFAVILAIFINKDGWEKLFKVLLGIGVLAFILGIVQYFGILGNVFITRGRITSLLGNSTFLAIYMMFLSFLALNFIIKEQNKKKKIIHVALLGLFISTILITGARATYLGIFIAFLYFLFFYPKKDWRHLKAIKMATAVFLALAISLVVFVNTSSNLPNFIENNVRLSYLIKNRLSLDVLAKDLLGVRFSTWKTTLLAIKEKPLFGWGPENFYIGFEKYYNPLTSNSNGWWDRPHNVFLEVAVNSGVPAFIFYLIFWAVLLWQLQKIKRANPIAHTLQAMFIGYLIALFFNFDSFATYIISFFFIGYGLYLISQDKEKTEIPPPKTAILKNKALMAALLITTIVFLWFFNIKPLYFAEKMSYAYNLAEIGSCKKALPIAESSLQKSLVLNAFLGLKYADAVEKCANLENEAILSKKSIDALKISANLQPKYTRTWIFLASFTNVLAARTEDSQEQNNLLSEARNYLKKAEELSPKRFEILIELEKNYLISKNYQAMKNIAQKCIETSPNEGICYWYMGISEIFMGQVESGEKYIKESKEKEYTDPPLVQLGVAYLSQKNYEKAAEVYDRLIEKYAKNPSYHAMAAALARQLGNYKKAATEALEVFKLQPDNPESWQFVETLFKENSSNPVVRASLAYIYREMGATQKNMELAKKSEEIYVQLTNEYPRKREYHFELAKTYQVLGKYDLARSEAFAAAQISKDSPEYRYYVQDFLNDLPISPDMKILPD